MRNVQEIEKEIERCILERDIKEVSSTEWCMYNDRVWTLRWTLQTEVTE